MLVTAKNPVADEPPCEGKLRFDTQKEANAAALVANHQRGSSLTVYKCRHCGWWHLSSN